MPLSPICLIVPVYNECKRLSPQVFIRFMTDHREVSLIFVDDASTDGSVEILSDIVSAHASRVGIVHHPVRLGKAAAIRTGMLKAMQQSKFAYFAFIDADLAVPIEDIIRFTQRLSLGDHMMAIGIRADVNKQNITRTKARRAMGELFKVYLHKVLKFRIADSQCGAKVFTASVAPVLYSKPFATHWLMDIELMIRYCDHFRIKRSDLQSHVIQVPVSAFEDRANSKFNIKELFRTLGELMEITLHYPSM